MRPAPVMLHPILRTQPLQLPTAKVGAGFGSSVDQPVRKRQRTAAVRRALRTVDLTLVGLCHAKISASFHVRQGNQRLCLFRVDSPQPIRDHIRAGDLLPLDRGVGGARVIGVRW